MPGGILTLLVALCVCASGSAARAQVTGARVPSFQSHSVWRWSVRNGEGYRSTNVLRAGTFGHLAALPLLPGFSSLSPVRNACGRDFAFNSETTAVLPATVSVRNDTAGFAQTLDFTLTPLPFQLYQPRNHSLQDDIFAVVGYASGPVCIWLGQGGINEPRKPWAVEWTQVPPRQSRSNSAYLLFPHFYSPNFPSGDPQLRANALLDLNITARDSSVRLITLSGPRLARTAAGRPIPVGSLGGRLRCRKQAAAELCGP